jgi:hypothetical protein
MPIITIYPGASGDGQELAELEAADKVVATVKNLRAVSKLTTDLYSVQPEAFFGILRSRRISILMATRHPA